MTELSNVEMNQKELYKVVCENISHMLIRRKLIKTNLTDTIINTIITDKMYNFELDGKKIGINIINQEVKNISSGSPIDEYLSKNIDYIKFVIVKSFSKKTYVQVNTEFKNAEIFTIDEFLEDIPAKEIIPEHQLLNDEDKKELMESFALAELPRIHSTDMMARYYGAKINDVFRVIRPNLNSGTSIMYRVVVLGNMDIF